MSEPESLVLRYLRQIDQKVDRLVEDMRDMKVRMSSMEQNMTVVQRRLDRFDDRFDRIERRLELQNTPPGVRE
ncbi:hypothetical protein [Brevundimonas sp.]|uniref:hypothetical protein n=1 Tax=Brevundimonas sp. TaxID=1871086 RepID=UPI002869ED31|nr:hypothetical protein [Brevundimonas sp.]